MPKPKSQAAFGASNFSSANMSSFGGFTGDSSSSLSYLAPLPDISKISNSAIVVTFKNLFKKDPKTKLRGLEEFTTYLTDLIESKEPLEDPILGAWLAIYPRMSIEPDRRNRQLAHQIQGKIGTLAGKRIVPHLSPVMGSWLLGLHDGDKLVTNTAQASLDEVFPTPEKQSLLFQKYASDIMSTCQDIIFVQTPETLADVRFVNIDEANMKYHRVLASALGVLGQLTSTFPNDKIPEQQLQEFQVLFEDSKFWSLISSKDSSVRRQISRLIPAIISRSSFTPLFDGKIISSKFITKGLTSDQSTSTVSLLEALLALTQAKPDVWTSEWDGQKSPVIRLAGFLEKGSQSSNMTYWNKVGLLIKAFPPKVISSSSDIEFILKAFQLGLHRKDEPRASKELGLKAYLSVLFILTEPLEANDAKAIQEQVVKPILLATVKDDPESAWNISRTQIDSTINSISRLPFGQEIVFDSITQLAESMVKAVKLSLPAQSAEYNASQLKLVDKSLYWGALVSRLVALYDIKISTPVLVMLKETIGVCRSRNGKPFGASRIIQETINGLSTSMLKTDEFQMLIDQLLLEVIPENFISPSMQTFAKILARFKHSAQFTSSWKSCFKSVQKVTWDKSDKLEGIACLSKALLLDANGTPVVDKDALNEFLDEIIHGPSEALSLFPNILDLVTAGVINQPQVGSLTKKMLEKLSIQERNESRIAFLQSLNPDRLQAALNNDSASALLEEVLQWADDPDDSLRIAANDVLISVRSIVKSKNVWKGRQSLGFFIRDQIIETTESSMDLTLLLNFTDELIKTEEIFLVSLIPDPAVFENALEPFINTTPPIPQYLNSQISEAVLLLDREQQTTQNSMIIYDGEQRSQAFRIAAFVGHVLNQPDLIFTSYERPNLSRIIELWLVACHVANEQYSLHVSRFGPSGNELADFFASAMSFKFSTFKNMQNWWTGSGDRSEDLESAAFETFDLLWNNAQGNAAKSFWSASVFADCIDWMDASWNLSDTRMTLVNDQFKQAKEYAISDPVKAIALITAYSKFLHKIKPATRWYNELIADLTGAESFDDPLLTNKRLALLHAMVKQQGKEILETAARTRLVTLVNHLSDQISSESTSETSLILIFAIIKELTPSLVELYDDFWETILDSISALWKAVAASWDTVKLNDIHMPLLMESVQVVKALRDLTKNRDCNDDLKDAIKALDHDLRQNLFELLALDPKYDSAIYLPQKSLDGRICQLLEKSTLRKLETTPDKVYPLLNRHSESVQNLAYSILHRIIQKPLEQVSLDLAVGDLKIATLPDELISLVMEPPPLELDQFNKWAGVTEDVNFDNEIPDRLRCYALSWAIIFDHFKSASEALRQQYIDHIKEIDGTKPLLDFVFQFLGRGSKTLYDPPENEFPENFQMNGQAPPRQELEGFFCRLYFNAALYIPQLVKGWWIDLSYRNLGQEVEKWTEKYISPHIIHSKLKETSSWSEKSNDDEKLKISINLKGSEVIASYTVTSVDSEFPYTLEIAVGLPKAFPLQQAHVSSRGEKVGVVEQKRWDAWLRTSQGMIAFSNNNLVTGIIGWRRNIEGALAGKSDCYICYSLISEDGRLPTKKCKTCKNIYHSSCLNKWFQSSRNTTCPICRSPFVAADAPRRTAEEIAQMERDA
jgi:hypothetical protein